MVACRPNKTNEHQTRNTKTRNGDYDVDLHVFLWEDPHEDILWRKKPAKKETETTLFTTEATQQKQHTTQTHSILIRRHFGPLLVFAPCSCIRTLVV